MGTDLPDLALAYKYLPNELRTPVDRKAKKRAKDSLSQEGYDNLEATSAFNAVHVETTLEDEGPDPYYTLTPVITGIDMYDNPDLHAAATDYGHLVVRHTYDAVQRIQEDSVFSIREFLTLLLDQDHTEQEIADLMKIEVGTVRGKKGRIEDKLSDVWATLFTTDHIEQTNLNETISEASVQFYSKRN